VGDRFIGGKKKWMSPEQATFKTREQPFDGEKSDVYSCGIILMMMLNRRFMYPFTNSVEYYGVMSRLGFDQFGNLKPLGNDNGDGNGYFCEADHISNGLLGLFQRMVDPDPSRRATSVEVMEHINMYFREGPGELAKTVERFYEPFRDPYMAAGEQQLRQTMHNADLTDRLVRLEVRSPHLFYLNQALHLQDMEYRRAHHHNGFHHHLALATAAVFHGGGAGDGGGGGEYAQQQQQQQQQIQMQHEARGAGGGGGGDDGGGDDGYNVEEMELGGGSMETCAGAVASRGSSGSSIGTMEEVLVGPGGGGREGSGGYEYKYG
jgi:hypothetical protein